LVTVVTLVEAALNRIELLIQSVEAEGEAEQTPRQITGEQIRGIHELIQNVRRRLMEAVNYFTLRPQKPGPRQILAGELSQLWVILENARPEKIRGYGREFSPGDKAHWEDLIQRLLADIEQIRLQVFGNSQSTI
jgi:hypothetical protein